MTFYQKERLSPVRHTTIFEVNEFLVLDHIREHDPTTRTEIARDLGLSPASVSRIVGRLRQDGLVTETGTQQAAHGRPRTTVSFRKDAGAVVAIDLGGTRCHAALADLAGTILTNDVRPTQSAGTPFATLTASVQLMYAEAARRGIPVVALAVGVPAIIDRNTGLAGDAPYVGWKDFPVVDSLASVVDVPFVVDNDANLAALAHAWRGDGRHIDDFVTLSIGTGVGAGIVSGGRLISGHHNAAGELAYLVIRPEWLRRQVVGGLGAFESVASGPGIAERARQLLAAGRTSTLEEVQITPRAIIEGAEAGDELCRSVVDELLDDLAVAVIALVSTVDPELIILEGGLGRSLGLWLDALNQRVAPSVPALPRIVTSRLGPDATVIGAIAAGLELARRRDAPKAVLWTSTMTGVGRDGS